jgi:hypothetical protein
MRDAAGATLARRFFSKANLSGFAVGLVACQATLPLIRALIPPGAAGLTWKSAIAAVCFASYSLSLLSYARAMSRGDTSASQRFWFNFRMVYFMGVVGGELAGILSISGFFR